MQKIRLLVSYKGTAYCGWQKQKEHRLAPDRPSVQETLELALARLFGGPVSLSASGRTDAGVHALGQVCHFETTGKIPQDLCWAMRALLPGDIVVKKAFLAPADFHSTLSAESKTYRYWVWNGPRPTALLRDFTWWRRKPIDLEKLNALAASLVGEQDFASFRTQGTPVKTTRRHIFRAEWTRRPSGVLQFEVRGTGFLKQMVRNLVGTQIEMELNGQGPDAMQAILASASRQAAGVCAPPEGLFLYRVYYPRELDNRCRQI